MSPDDLKTVLERLKKPLSFASRNDFAHLNSLADIEVFARAQIEALRHLGGDPGECAELAAVFAGFDGAPLDQKKARIRNAITLSSTPSG